MIQFKVNGVEQSSAVNREMPLLLVSARRFRMTGSKFGVRRWALRRMHGPLERQATRSCVQPWQMRPGKEVTTIEGLDKNGLHPVQGAWDAINVPQCGYLPGGTDHAGGALLEKQEEAYRSRNR